MTNEVSVIIKHWQSNFKLNDWHIVTSKIHDTGSIDYNGETYFVGIERDFKNKVGTIYHDIPLTEHHIVHELLHIKYKQLPSESYQEYERFIELNTRFYLLKETFKHK